MENNMPRQKKIRPNARRSAVWKMDREELISLLEKSNTLAEVLIAFNLKNKGSNYRTLKRRIVEDGLESYYEEFVKNQTRAAIEACRIPIEEQLVKNSSAKGTHLKKKIIKAKLLPYLCSECGLKDEWNNKPIVLQLDHKNGVSNDNRIGNLRFLCPNCHSQTHTFCRKK